MIKKITLDNFKAFKHAEIEIKPITILVGPNNGGKSSILQAIGLIQQTLKLGGPEEVLKFRTPHLNLGNFDTLIHQDLEKKEMHFNFELEDGKYFDINVLKNPDNNEVYVKDFSCNNGRFEYTINEITKKKGTPKDESAYYVPKTFKFDIKTSGKEKYKEFFETFIPTFYRNNFFFIIAFYEEKKDKMFLIPDIFESTKSKANIRSDFMENLRFYLNLQKISTDFYQNIKQDFQNIIYIGPLRAIARRSYEKGDYNDVGTEGEHAVQILASNSEIRNDSQEYLKKMDIVNSLYVSEMEENSKIFEFKLKTKITDKEVNYADTGSGTAQILPLIVQSLKQQKESLILIEQPEIHLHPKIQADLADFFVKFASNERKFLLETHSDYFIERIRYCIMNEDISSDNVAIYYIEQDEDKKCSTYTEIKINSKGQYSTSNLPDGNLPDNYVTNFKLEENRKMMKKLLENLSKEK
ncbi:DNA replication and repair protein RecF [uncultured archaeon]|nr:DNA replication and repair protein RecF [uncultured archaeon]